MEDTKRACVDEQTEALTPLGWKRHDELNDGDLIAAFDLKSGLLDWEPAKFVRYAVVEEEMVQVEHRSVSMLVTTMHRVLLWTPKRPLHVKLASEVGHGNWIPLSAPWRFHDCHGPGKELAELLGWYIAEGWPDSRTACIAQSESANPEKCKRIRELLIATGATYRERRRERPAGVSFAPGPRTAIEFIISGDVSLWLRTVVPHKTLTAEIVFGWSKDECSSLMGGLIDGDGYRDKRTTSTGAAVHFFQKRKETAEMFQCLATRCGFRARINSRSPSRVGSDNGWVVSVTGKQFVTLRGRSASKSGPLPRTSYTGTVWCPNVKSGFWLASRKGMPFLTGNSLI